MNMPVQFTFYVSSQIPETVKNYPCAYLLPDGWDDWFEYSTKYWLYIFDLKGDKHLLGSVKIGQFNMLKEQRRPNIPNTFLQLSNQFFSLGQDDNYYNTLKKLEDTLQIKILTGMQDIVNDAVLFERSLHERVTKVSLLRSVSPTTIRGQFSRIVQGGARLSRYDFLYHYPTYKGEAPSLSFHVIPESNPPTNIHILIGRNGVGKTHLLNNMTRALIDKDALSRNIGYFETAEDELFAGLVSVTFSAFDPFEPLPEKKDKSEGINYSYIGLKRTNNIGGEKGMPKSQDILSREFEKSLIACLQTLSKEKQLIKALTTLESDPVFEDANILELLEDPSGAKNVFNRLSSGHKIVLLTITRLIETIEERTLVLLDEPETHLHPPLLSAFIRALSDLLIYRNGVSIIATHSPVVLQEVPKSCVWKLNRFGLIIKADRPELETFGENVGTLTREIFGLEVTKSGFHKLLESTVKEKDDFESVLYHFRDQLGAEAQAISRSLLNIKHTSEK